MINAFFFDQLKIILLMVESRHSPSTWEIEMMLSRKYDIPSQVHYNILYQYHTHEIWMKKERET